VTDLQALATTTVGAGLLVREGTHRAVQAAVHSNVYLAPMARDSHKVGAA